MIRFYSAQGWEPLRPYAGQCGSFHCLAPDENGGQLGMFPDADVSIVNILQTIPGVYVFPNNLSAPLPSALASVLPPSLAVILTDTGYTALQKINAVHNLVEWNPDF